MRSLIAYDGSKSADEVCDLVAAIDWPPWSELRVVTAYAPYLPGSFAPDELFDPATPGIVFEADREAAEARAKVAAARIGLPTTTVTWAAVHGPPASVFRGRTGLERLLLGSVARKVLQHAPCSVSDRARAGAVGSSLGRIWPARVYQRVVTPRHGWPWRG